MRMRKRGEIKNSWGERGERGRMLRVTKETNKNKDDDVRKDDRGGGRQL